MAAADWPQWDELRLLTRREDLRGSGEGGRNSTEYMNECSVSLSGVIVDVSQRGCSSC